MNFFKSFKSFLKLEWTALALATTMKVVYSTKKKSATWQLSQQSLSRNHLNRKKKIFWLFLKSFNSPLKVEWIALALATTMKTAYSKKKSLMRQVSRQSLSKNQLNRKKKEFEPRKKDSSPPLKLEWTTFALPNTRKIVYSTSKNHCGNFLSSFSQSDSSFFSFFFKSISYEKWTQRPSWASQTPARTRLKSSSIKKNKKTC